MRRDLLNNTAKISPAFDKLSIICCVPRVLVALMFLMAACSSDSTGSEPNDDGGSIVEGPATLAFDGLCSNDTEIGGYVMADDSPDPPVAWQNRDIEGVVERVDDSTITFVSGDVELLFTNSATDALCRGFEGGQ